jgi:hypothetical protein
MDSSSRPARERRARAAAACRCSNVLPPAAPAPGRSVQRRHSKPCAAGSRTMRCRQRLRMWRCRRFRRVQHLHARVKPLRQPDDVAAASRPVLPHDASVPAVRSDRTERRRRLARIWAAVSPIATSVLAPRTGGRGGARPSRSSAIRPRACPQAARLAPQLRTTPRKPALTRRPCARERHGRRTGEGGHDQPADREATGVSTEVALHVDHTVPPAVELDHERVEPMANARDLLAVMQILLVHPDASPPTPPAAPRAQPVPVALVGPWLALAHG